MHYRGCTIEGLSHAAAHWILTKYLCYEYYNLNGWTKWDIGSMYELLENLQCQFANIKNCHFLSSRTNDIFQKFFGPIQVYFSHFSGPIFCEKFSALSGVTTKSLRVWQIKFLSCTVAYVSQSEGVHLNIIYVTKINEKIRHITVYQNFSHILLIIYRK